MSVLKVFAIYDSKAEAYLPPFMYPARGQAIRGFVDCANDEHSFISRYPEDYTLF